MKFVFAANRERQAGMMREAAELLRRTDESGADFHVLPVETQEAPTAGETAVLTGADFVLIAWMGYDDENPFLRQSAALLQQQRTPYAIVAAEVEPAAALRGVTPEQYDRLRRYLLYGGRENYRNLWRYIAHAFGRADAAPEPVRLHWNGIFHPRAAGVFTDPAVYRQIFCRAGRPTVGILFSRDAWLSEDMAGQRALIEEIERQDMNAVAVFSPWGKNAADGAPGLAETVEAFFYEAGAPVVDVVINTFSFSLTAGQPEEQAFLHELDRPVLQAYGLFGPAAEWRASHTGMTPLEISFGVAMPEFDGVIHGVPLAGKETEPDGTRRYAPLSDRAAILVRKAKKWANLRLKANRDKRVAVIFHNYPATNASIGSAQGLDSPASVRLILQALQARGYRIDAVPADGRALMDTLLAGVTNDRRFLDARQAAQAAGRLPAAAYQTFFDGLPARNRTQLTRDWQTPPGDVFLYDGALLAPGQINGNVLITVQPPRGFGEDPGKILHAPDCAPTHHYLAYYHWLRDVWQADAVLHIGAHGSLEWLPGKGAGLSEECYPELALGDLPNIYPYLLTIVGEGIQAKRRGAACLIGHLPPPVSRAGTYEEWAELEKLLDEYTHFQAYEMPAQAATESLIRQKAAALHLDGELGEDAAADFTVYRQRLHTYLTDIKHMQIRVGLHVFGCPPAEAHWIDYVLALVQADNGAVPSLPKTIAAAAGHDYDGLLQPGGQIGPDGAAANGAILDLVRARERELVEILDGRGYGEEALRAAAALPWLRGAPAQAATRLSACCRYICETVVPNLTRTEQETTNLLRALEGKFVEPGPAGAPTSGCADILPTGRNFYGVDPATLPTPAAWEIGKILGDAVVARFIQEEGRYPESIGMVLWAGCNIRSHGQCVAEFLYLLGVKPVWQAGSRRVVGLAVIEPAELKRPRIDVTARISGLLRDTLPQAAVWLDKAARLVADLDEAPADNYVRKHVLEDRAALREQKADEQQAYYRVFGCPPGTYGAGVGAMLEAKNWESVDDLAAVYVRWGAHAYGATETGRFAPAQFSRRLQTIEVTVKNEDNREVHMLNSDDFNAYHGGMIAAVRSLRGQAPRSYCGDSSDRRSVKLRALDEEVRQLFRGEVMNPKYIEGMMRHGYKGAADLAATVAHCYEWDATSAVMEDWMYDGLAQKYALDKKMQEWMKDVNPWALARVAEKLLEAAQRGLWRAGDANLQELRRLYLSVEGDLEERGDAAARP